jgi:hypothetical protein
MRGLLTWLGIDAGETFARRYFQAVRLFLRRALVPAGLTAGPKGMPRSGRATFEANRAPGLRGENGHFQLVGSALVRTLHFVSNLQNIAAQTFKLGVL